MIFQHLSETFYSKSWKATKDQYFYHHMIGVRELFMLNVAFVYVVTILIIEWTGNEYWILITNLFMQNECLVYENKYNIQVFY